MIAMMMGVIDKIYLYAKDPNQANYQYLIKKRESSSIKGMEDPKTIIDYSNNMKDVYKNIDDYNTRQEIKCVNSLS